MNMQTPDEFLSEVAGAHMGLTSAEIIEIALREYAANEAKMFGHWLLTNTFEASDMDQLYQKFKTSHETSTDI